MRPEQRASTTCCDPPDLADRGQPSSSALDRPTPRRNSAECLREAVGSGAHSLAVIPRPDLPTEHALSPRSTANCATQALSITRAPRPLLDATIELPDHGFVRDPGIEQICELTLAFGRPLVVPVVGPLDRHPL
jgi:hypothetical protein